MMISLENFLAKEIFHRENLIAIIMKVFNGKEINFFLTYKRVLQTNKLFWWKLFSNFQEFPFKIKIMWEKSQDLLKNN